MVYPSQYAYRVALAEKRGFSPTSSGRRAMVRSVYDVREEQRKAQQARLDLRAEALGFESEVDRAAKMRQLRTDPKARHILAKVSREDVVPVGAFLYHYKGALGTHVQGQPKVLPPEIQAMLEGMGPERYLIFRWLYT